MKAAAYIRAPHDTAGDRERQLETIRRFVQQCSGWELSGVYAETSGSRRDRPSFRRLLAAAEQRTVDVIVIERLDRVADSLRELVQVFEAVGRCHVALVCLEEQIDTSTDRGISCSTSCGLSASSNVGSTESISGWAWPEPGLWGRRVGRPPAQVDPAEVRRLREAGLSDQQDWGPAEDLADAGHRLARAPSRSV